MGILTLLYQRSAMSFEQMQGSKWLFMHYFVCFVALHMAIAGRSVHLTTLFLGQLEQAVSQYFVRN